MIKKRQFIQLLCGKIFFHTKNVALILNEVEFKKKNTQNK